MKCSMQRVQKIMSPQLCIAPQQGRLDCKWALQTESHFASQRCKKVAKRDHWIMLYRRRPRCRCSFCSCLLCSRRYHRLRRPENASLSHLHGLHHHGYCRPYEFLNFRRHVPHDHSNFSWTRQFQKEYTPEADVRLLFSLLLHDNGHAFLLCESFAHASCWSEQTLGSDYDLCCCTHSCLPVWGFSVTLVCFARTR